MRAELADRRDRRGRMTEAPTAAAFLADLEAEPVGRGTGQDPGATSRPAPGEYGEGDTFIGVRMGTVFALARAADRMPLDEIETAPREPDPRGPRRRAADHGRAGRRPGGPRMTIVASCTSCTCGGSIGSTTGISSTWRRGTSSDATCSISRATSWYELAASDDLWARRTAILATLAFIRAGETDDAFRIADDPGRRPARPDPEGGRRHPPGGRRRRIGRGLEALPRAPCRDDAADVAPLRHRAPRPGRPRPVPRDAGGPLNRPAAVSSSCR